MRFNLPIVAAVLLLSGCSHTRPVTPPKQTAGKTKLAPQIIPVEILQGKVVTVNAQLRFVIVDFGLGPTPSTGQTLDVYRKGMKVGELKISDQSRTNLFAADVVAGEAQVGDEVRRRP